MCPNENAFLTSKFHQWHSGRVHKVQRLGANGEKLLGYHLSATLCVRSMCSTVIPTGARTVCTFQRVRYLEIVSSWSFVYLITSLLTYLLLRMLIIYKFKLRIFSIGYAEYFNAVVHFMCFNTWLSAWRLVNRNFNHIIIRYFLSYEVKLVKNNSNIFKLASQFFLLKT